MTRIAKYVSAAALFATFATAAQAADVSSIQGRAALAQGIPTQQVLLTGTSVNDYVGRAAPTGYNKLAARFVGAPSSKGFTANVVANRQGRA